MTDNLLDTDLNNLHGPFDIIGDVHGCFDEMIELLIKMGYELCAESDCGPYDYFIRHPDGRMAIFLGDIVDRGPNIPGVLRLVMRMVRDGVALCLPGNHDMKLLRAIRGGDVEVKHGLAESLSQLEQQGPDFKRQVEEFLDGLVNYYTLDDGKLVVAHAGMKEELQGLPSASVRSFALYGETTGETDEFGLPVRYNWAATYRGRAMVVYGHTPVRTPEWLNNTINIDTGCVFGGKLTALRYPEKELVSVSAKYTYYRPARPFMPEEEHAPSAPESRKH